MDDDPNHNEQGLDAVGQTGWSGRATDERSRSNVGNEDMNGGPSVAAIGSVSDQSIEYIWSHGEAVGAGFKCHYYNKQIKGGGATRFREHLAGVIGNVAVCPKVPKDVRETMKFSRLSGKARRRAKRKCRLRVENEIAQTVVNVLTGNDHKQNFIEIASDASDEDVQIAVRRSLRDLNMQVGVGSSGSSRSGSTIASCAGGKKRGAFDIDLARNRAPVQPRIDRAFNSKELKEKLGKAWARWFHANDIAGRKANCPYFRAAMKLTQQLGEGLPCPTGEDIDGTYLQINYDEVQQNLECFKKDWDKYGVSLMCDSWTGLTGDSIINFMVYCNEQMFFHKTINATGQIQNASFLYDCIKEVVVEEIGEDRVMQIVTDNGSNYKKACSQLIKEYPRIIWQPCAAHTINLLLKDIGRFTFVDRVVSSTQRICKFFYNHNRLHAEMKRHIGGELYRWNATRFGTIFVFLQSFWDRMDKFRQWMVSEEWKNNDYNNDNEYLYAEDCLTKRQWWDNVKYVLDLVGPIYYLLRFADSQKIGTVSGFLPRVMAARHQLEAHLSGQREILKNILSLLDKRVTYMYNNTLMVAAGVLDPEAHYKFDFSAEPAYLKELAIAIERVADSPDSAVRAISEFQFFKAKKGMFGTTTARLAALSHDVTPTNWWSLYGGDTKNLQKYALRIVSQCVSSSGCERNWSTFSLVHTKLRNRLSYAKLHKLVFVHYNLKLAVQRLEVDHHEKVADPFGDMMDVALFDHNNPITDWLNGSLSESRPALDEEDGQPSRELCREMWEAGLVGKRKCGGVKSKRLRKQSKEGVEEEYVGSDSDTETPCEDIEMDSSSSNEDANENEACGDGGVSNDGERERVEGEALEKIGEGITRPVRSCRQRTVDIQSLYGIRK